MVLGNVKRSTEELINDAVARQKLWMARMRERGKQLLKYLAKHSIKTVQTLVAVTPLVNKLQDNEVSRQSYWTKISYLISVFFVLAIVAGAAWLTFGGGWEKLRGGSAAQVEMISESQESESVPAETVAPEPASELKAAPAEPKPELKIEPESKPAAAAVKEVTIKEAAPTPTGEYIVQPGDNLWNIATANFGDGMKFKALAEYNNIPNPDMIYPGQVLVIRN